MIIPVKLAREFNDILSQILTVPLVSPEAIKRPFELIWTVYTLFGTIYIIKI